tara:strand:+ start:8365 stop:8961 length:597 start_codon:yes stop_codon:yes gene_type:complete
MSGTLPITPKFQSLSIQSIQPSLTVRTISGRRQSRQIGGQLWRMTITYPSMTRAEFQPILAFFISQRGAYDTFQVRPTVHEDTTGGASGSPTVNGASQTGRTVTTDNWPNSTTVMKAGDFIKFGGHTKIYMLTGDATSDGSGNASLTIEPALLTSPSDNDTVIYNDIPFTMSFDSDVTEFTTNSSGMYQYSIELVEAF